MCRVVFRHKSRLFHAWKQVTARECLYRLRLQQFIKNKRISILQHSIATWIQSKNNRLFLRRVLYRACEFRRVEMEANSYYSPDMMIPRCFTAWQIGVHLLQQDRRHDAIVTSITEVRSRHLVLKAFKVWRTWHQEKKEDMSRACATLKQITATQTAASYSIVLRRWIEYVRLKNARYVMGI